jgi:hypothetical protein
MSPIWKGDFTAGLPRTFEAFAPCYKASGVLYLSSFSSSFYIAEHSWTGSAYGVVITIPALWPNSLIGSVHNFPS